MSAIDAVFVHCADLDRLHYPADCPFKTSRAGRTRDAVAAMGLLNGPRRKVVEPRPLTRAELEAFHEPRYLDALRAAAGGELGPEGFAMGLGTPDCPVFPDMYDYPALACGATVEGARLLLEGAARVAFNPSGGYHHAMPDRAGGFCYLNDIVFGCRALAAAGRRVAFLDIDVHHCDGVQAAFYDRADVMTISLHETGHSLFPGTGFEDHIGEGAGRGYSVNVPLPPGTDDRAYLAAFHAVASPLMEAFAPDAVVVEAGMDALSGDPLAHLRLTNNAYAEIAEWAVAFGRPLLVTGGGGYNADNTVRGWSLLWSILCGAGADNEMSLGLGGVMLEGTEWHGGLRDRPMLSRPGRIPGIDDAIARTAERVKRLVFPLHGI